MNEGGYKIREWIVFRDSRGEDPVLRVHSDADDYQTLLMHSASLFEFDKDIRELALFFCWDNDAGLTMDACLLRVWNREVK